MLAVGRQFVKKSFGQPANELHQPSAVDGQQGLACKKSHSCWQNIREVGFIHITSGPSETRDTQSLFFPRVKPPLARPWRSPEPSKLHRREQKHTSGGVSKFGKFADPLECTSGDFWVWETQPGTGEAPVTDGDVPTDRGWQKPLPTSTPCPKQHKSSIQLTAPCYLPNYI